MLRGIQLVLTARLEVGTSKGPDRTSIDFNLQGNTSSAVASSDILSDTRTNRKAAGSAANLSELCFELRCPSARSPLEREAQVQQAGIDSTLGYESELGCLLRFISLPESRPFSRDLLQHRVNRITKDERKTNGARYYSDRVVRKVSKRGEKRKRKGRRTASKLNPHLPEKRDERPRSSSNGLLARLFVQRKVL